MSYATIISPCGHAASIDEAWTAPDRYRCPKCGLQWCVDTAPARLLPSGFCLPGSRTIRVISRGRTRRQGLPSHHA